MYVRIRIYKLIYLCFRNHMESKAAFNDEITMKDSLRVMSLWIIFVIKS